jgi:glycosyltransferase involved in cell wall biosynthesis
MHVVMTTDATGGPWTFSLTLTAALHRRGIEVTLIGIGPAPTPQQLAQLPTATRFIATDYKLEWQADLKGDIALSGAFIARLIDDLVPELFHSNHYCYGSLATGAAKVVVAHNDLLSWLTWCRHDGDYRRLVVPPGLLDYQAFVEEGLASADVVVCPSHFMASSLAAHYKARPRTIVIPNGVPAPSLPVTPRPANRPLAAVIAGRLWDEAKNADLAVEGIYQSRAGTRLLAVGPTVSPDGLARSLPDDERVTPLGLLPAGEVEQQYRAADVYLAVSRYEPFGLAPLEAALTGCAVICNDLPSYHEVWGDVAVYFQRNDPADLARVLDELANDRQRLHHCQQRAQQRALAFTADVMADNYVALYRQLTDRSRVGPGEILSDPTPRLR